MVILLITYNERNNFSVIFLLMIIIVKWLLQNMEVSRHVNNNT